MRRLTICLQSVQGGRGRCAEKQDVMGVPRLPILGVRLLAATAVVLIALEGLSISPDGTLLASAGFPEHHVRLWDLRTQRVCRVFAGHARPVNSVAFSPDGSLLATAGNDGMLGLWTVATGQRRDCLDSQATPRRTVAFSPDGRTLILATHDDDDVLELGTSRNS